MTKYTLEIFTVCECVPISTVISLYGLHLIDAQSTVSRIIAKLIHSFYCNFYIGLYKAIRCKPYSEITVESGTHLKTVYTCSAATNDDTTYCTRRAETILTLNSCDPNF